MGVFEMIVLLVFIVTVGEVVKTAVAGRNEGAGAKAVVGAVEAKLLEAETRLGAAEERVNQLEEKVDFLENLLARPEAPGRLPDPRDGA